MFSRRTLAVAGTALALIFGGTAYAATTTPTASCTANPAITNDTNGTTQSIRVRCSWPKPAPVTVTSTVTQTVTASPTTSATSDPSTTTTTPPATTTTTTPAPTTSTTTASPSACTVQWTSSASFGSWDNGGYVVNNNKWDSSAGPQTISACSWHQWSIVSNQGGTGTDDGVKTYPDTQRHVSYPLSSLTTLPSTFDVTTPSAGWVVPAKGKQWNASYDLWLDNFGTEVMVWNNWTMNWQYWYGVYKGQQVTIDGVLYNAYTNGSGGLWFIRDASNVTNKGTVDLAHILQWAVGKGWLKSSQTLGEVEYGFEVAYTGEPTTFTLNDYTLALP